MYRILHIPSGELVMVGTLLRYPSHRIAHTYYIPKVMYTHLHFNSSKLALFDTEFEANRKICSLMDSCAYFFSPVTPLLIFNEFEILYNEIDNEI